MSDIELKVARPISDDDVRATFNAARDGTVNDAIKRHLCRIALNECCISDAAHPDGERYPTALECDDARTKLWLAINGRCACDDCVALAKEPR